MTEDDVMTVATPTSLKSPSFTGSTGLPTVYHIRTLSEVEDEATTSRPSSVSEDVVNNGK